MEEVTKIKFDDFINDYIADNPNHDLRANMNLICEPSFKGVYDYAKNNLLIAKLVGGDTYYIDRGCL